jgi:hypothetical protein
MNYLDGASAEYSRLSGDAKTDLPLSRQRRENHLVSATDARRSSACSGVLCRFFTEAEKISVEIFNIEVFATPWSFLE